MPIGPYSDFQGLKEHLRASYASKGGLSPDRLNAMTAAVASKMKPGWRKEAAAKAARTRSMGAKPKGF